jgi:Helix-turn-helix domain
MNVVRFAVELLQSTSKSVQTDRKISSRRFRRSALNTFPAAWLRTPDGRATDRRHADFSDLHILDQLLKWFICASIGFIVPGQQQMLIQRANKYRSEPTPYQAQAMGQWVGTCRHEVNHARTQAVRVSELRVFPLLRTSGEGIDRPARRHRLDRLRSRPRPSIRPSRIGHSVPAVLCRPWRLSEAAEEVQERLLHAAGRRRRIQAPEQEPRCQQSSQDRLGTFPRLPTARRKARIRYVQPQGGALVRVLRPGNRR